MKRLPLIGLLLIIGCVGAFAQNPAPAAPKPPAAAAPTAPSAPAVPGKSFAIVDFTRALVESDPGKALQSTYDKEMKPFSDRLEALRKDIMDLQTKGQNAKTDTERNSINREIDSKNTEGQRLQEDTQRHDQEVKDKFLQPIAGMVNKAIDEYAKSHDLALVLDPTTEPSNIVYATPAMDITNEIIRMVNAAYAKDPKLAQPSATPAAAAPAPAKN
jgi:Skp family chaperone for outer membrane proteins